MTVHAIHAYREGQVQRDLVARAQHGDRVSFGLLAEASIARLYNLALLMLSDGDLADDAVQETLIAAWRDLRALRDLDRFDSWLHRVLVRSVYRVAKSERRHTLHGPFVQPIEPTVPDSTGAIENRDAIDRGFRRIKAEHRAVLAIHHYLGLTDEEAAEVLGVPGGTFKSRLHRATEALRAELDAEMRRGDRLAAGAPR